MYPSRGNQPRSLFQIRYPNGVRPSASNGHRADRTIITTKKPVRMSSQATLPSACFRLWPRSLTSPMTNPIARWTYAARMERTMKSVICSSFSSGAWTGMLTPRIPEQDGRIRLRGRRFHVFGAMVLLELRDEQPREASELALEFLEGFRRDPAFDDERVIRHGESERGFCLLDRHLEVSLRGGEKAGVPL